MTDEAIEMIYDAAKKRRSCDLSPPDGTYGYREEYF